MGASGAMADAVPRQRLRLAIRGIVQGVGFRPFVYREARQAGLGGFVANTGSGVVVEVEGTPAALAGFVTGVRASLPGPASISSLESETLLPSGETEFVIRPSTADGDRMAAVLPDLATCDECLAELFDPLDRRHRYPFVNCTRCGPRYSIVEGLPYDRARTSMRKFILCVACQAEYDDPADRRFHAEPNACPDCGPQLALWDAGGRVLAEKDAALLAAADAIRGGKIVAIKGLGGFHLVVDARNDPAVRRLRRLKQREEKPFAAMFPSLASICGACAPGEAEAALLASPERPIVLVRRQGGDALAEAVAPGNPLLGAMLPYTPLHHLLLAELGFPVVATSGNRSNEPIVIDEHEALVRLAGIADLFLVHDRPIVRPIDDSVARIVAGRPMLLRRARGFAPATALEREMPEGILALGGHLKTTLALTGHHGVMLGQHIGDLDTPEARDAWERARVDIATLQGIRPRLVVRDLHPGYHSSAAAEASGLPVVGVQHHLAHVVAGMADNGLDAPVLGVAWDGTGHGPDGTVWGGEFLAVGEGTWHRVAHLRPFRLPGGEAAVREPRRSALGLLFAAFGRDGLAMTDLAPVASFSAGERSTLATMLERGVNTPVATSAGRLFDAVAALIGLRQRCTYEGQAAAELEWAVGTTAPEDRDPNLPLERRSKSQSDFGRGSYGNPELHPLPKVDAPPAHRLSTSPQGGGWPLPLPTGRSYSFPLSEAPGVPLAVDWQPALEEILADLRVQTTAGEIARAFHLGLAAAIAAVAARIGEEKVVLSGGCFQNAFLTEATIAALRRDGFTPYWHCMVPPNDGGLALGQAVWAAGMVERGEV